MKEGGKEEGETGAVTADAAAPADSAPTNVSDQTAPLTDTTNEALTAEKGTDEAEKAKNRAATRERKQRGPPEDGVPSKTKVMVANLPYDLTEEKVTFFLPNFHF